MAESVLRIYYTLVGTNLAHTGMKVWGVPDGDVYPEGAIELIEHPTKPGLYESAGGVADKNYDIWVDTSGGASPVKDMDNKFHGDNRLTLIANHFDPADNNRIRSTGVGNQTLVVVSVTDPTPSYIGQPGRDSSGKNYVAVAVTGDPLWAEMGSGFESPITTVGDLIFGGDLGKAIRLPVGGVKQVLTGFRPEEPGAPVVPIWANPTPMTTQHDMIIGGVDGEAIRLAKGTKGKVLTAGDDGAPNWDDPAFVNPMTTVGDMIGLGQIGEISRLPIGGDGQLLKSVEISSGVIIPVWSDPSSNEGMVNPMSLSGDIIIGGVGGLAGRRGIGTEGQVLTVYETGSPEFPLLPIWSDVPKENPMTAQYDMVFGGASGVPTKLTKGSEGQVLGAGVGGVPVWSLGSTINNKGDIESSDGTTRSSLGLGEDGEVLTADSAEPLGVKWAIPAGGSGGSAVDKETAYTLGILDRQYGEGLNSNGKYFYEDFKGDNTYSQIQLSEALERIRTAYTAGDTEVDIDAVDMVAGQEVTFQDLADTTKETTTIKDTNGYLSGDISGSVSDGRVLYIASHVGSAYGMTISPDGTKLYLADYVGGDIHQYDLSTAWDISTAVYVGFFDVSAKEASLMGVAFSTDGTKMYVIGTSSDDVHTYSLSTAWDISTATFVSSFLTVGDTYPTALTFSPDGTKMYVSGLTGDAIREFTLSIAWDPMSSVYVTSLSTTMEDASMYGIGFSPDGLRLYALGNPNKTIYEYHLTVAWSLATATIFSKFVLERPLSYKGFCISTALDMFIIQDNQNVYSYEIWDVLKSPVAISPALTNNYAMDDLVYRSLGTKTRDGLKMSFDKDGYDIANAVFTGVAVGSYATNYTITFSPDGMFLHTCYYTLGQIRRYSLLTAWDISTMVDPATSLVISPILGVWGFSFHPDGMSIFVVSYNDDRIDQYELAVQNDVSSFNSTPINTISTTPFESSPKGPLTFRPDGLRAFMFGDGGDKIYELDLSIAWDISTIVHNGVTLNPSDTTLRDVKFSADGHSVFIDGLSQDAIQRWDMSTAWDLATAIFHSKFNYASIAGTNSGGFDLTPDGTKLITNNSYKFWEFEVGVQQTFVSQDIRFDVIPNEFLPKISKLNYWIQQRQGSWSVNHSISIVGISSDESYSPAENILSVNFTDRSSGVPLIEENKLIETGLAGEKITIKLSITGILESEVLYIKNILGISSNEILEAV